MLGSLWPRSSDSGKKLLQFQNQRYLVYRVSKQTGKPTQLPFTGRVSEKQTPNSSNTWLSRERGKGKGVGEETART